MAMPCFVVPKGTDASVAQAINAALAGIANNSDAVAQLAKLRYTYIHSDIQESVSIIKKCEELIKKSYELIL
jgi:uncharacterized protein YqgV (UPF0045/DUF77 family)